MQAALVYDALIVGAGIAGLALAGGLARRGWRIGVWERAPELPRVGAGLVLQPNAQRALEALGVGPVPGAPLRQMEIRSAAGRLLQTIDVDGIVPGLPPAAAVLRPDLAAALGAAAGAAGVEVDFGRACAGLRVDAGGVEARGSDGVVARAQVLIGADGIGSAVRAALRGGAGPAVVYAGATCWRALTPAPGFVGAVERWGRGRRVGTVACRDGQVYSFWVEDAAAGQPGGPETGWRERFRGFGAEVDALLDALEDDAVLHHDLRCLSGVDWGEPRVWLLGDAAHAMTPDLRQGAGLALEDAAEALVWLGAAGPAGAAAAHAALRGRRTARVQGLQARSRRVGQIAQWSNPVAAALRDTLAAWSPAGPQRALLRDIYAWEPPVAGAAVTPYRN